MSDEAIENEINEKGLNAPRVTSESIKAKIVGEDYYVFPNTTVTICLIKLENGFSVVGESAAASPDNFNEELGRKIAYEHAHDKIWALEGYLLREKLSQEKYNEH